MSQLRRLDESSSAISSSPAVKSDGRRPWVRPAVTQLPRLNQLTLQSIPCGGEPGGGGTGVCP